MRLSRIIYRLSLLNPRIEFLSILACMLFYPKSEDPLFAYIYFLVLSLLIILFSIRNILFLKNVALSSFSQFLTVFNLVLIFAIFFSVYRFGSIYFYADIFLISFYSVLFFFDKNKKNEYFQAIAYLLTLFSFLNIIHYYFPVIERKSLFFSNTILQGIISGIAVLIILFYLLQKFNRVFAVLLVINCGGLFVSRSKAAFIGCVCFAMLLIVLKNRKWVIVPAVLAVLTFIIPNPVKDTFHFSIKKDPYAFDRILIWQVSIEMFKNNLFTGVGPDNFAQVSQTYNFKQTKGPAQYFKVPRQSHNDYLKIAAETGLPGLLILCALLFFITRKIFSSSLFDITKILLLYLLFQAFLFNILFHAFFFLLLIFLLKILFEEELHFKSFHFNAKLVSFFSLIFVLIICYLFPFLSQAAIERSKSGQTPVEILNSLEKATYYNPLSFEPYYLKAVTFYNYFKRTADLEYFGNTLDNLKRVQRLNRYFTGSYLLESELHHLVWRDFNSAYVSLEEIISPLSKAEQTAPFDPFIKMRKAQVYLEFGEKEAAKAAALKALEIEPDFVSALYFLQRNFNYFEEESIFRTKIKAILEKAKKVSLVPGTYLYELYKMPQELNNDRR